MQLTRYTDYGLRTLMYVAMYPERTQLFRIAEITEVFDLSANHVSKVVHHLGKLGYLETIRGKSGGFRLGMPADQINVGKVVRQLENTLAPIDCNKPYCVLTPGCQLKGILNEAVKAYIAVLDNYTLQDVITNAQELRTLIPGVAATVVSLD